MTQDIDWNLLVALDVLLAEGSVTGAAERLHLSVPATSRTLGRIRQVFGDEILVRAGRGLVPTPRALALQQRLHQLIEDADALIQLGRDVDLGSLERTFTIRANDALISLITTRLIEHAGVTAPGVKLRFVPEGDEDLAPLRNGVVDLDLGVISDLGPEVRTEHLYHERYVGIVAAGHRLATGRVTLRRIADVDHVTVSRRGRLRGPLDDALEQHGLTRTVVAAVPSFTAAVDIINSSQLTGLIPAAYAAQVAKTSDAHCYDVPTELPSMPISQAWHLRHDLDPAHHWLRGQVATILRPDPPSTA